MLLIVRRSRCLMVMVKGMVIVLDRVALWFGFGLGIGL